MDISEIDSILTPNMYSWSTVECSILEGACDYPSSFPLVEPEAFVEFPSHNIELQEAYIGVDNSAISDKVIDRYFKAEQQMVEEYNKRRISILLTADNLTKQIDEWNVRNFEHWRQYAALTRSMVLEESAKFQLHFANYSNQSKAQQKHLETPAEGFNRGIKEAVVGRVGCIRGTLELPDSVSRQWGIYLTKSSIS
jgi:hypothetical protein